MVSSRPIFFSTSMPFLKRFFSNSFIAVTFKWKNRGVTRHSSPAKLLRLGADLLEYLRELHDLGLDESRERLGRIARSHVAEVVHALRHGGILQRRGEGRPQGADRFPR